VKKLFFSFWSLCFLVSCGDEASYPKVVENFIVSNNTDTTFVVVWDKVMFPEILPFDTVRRSQERNFYANKNNYELWLTEMQLKELYSNLLIFKTEGTDTLVVNKAIYSDIDCWNIQEYTDEWFGSVTFYNTHHINITDDMFIDK